MDSPIRPRVYVENERVWAPPMWRESRVLLRDDAGQACPAGEALDITDRLEFGAYNAIEGAPDTAYIEEASAPRLSGLQARLVNEERLAVEVRLSGTGSGHLIGILLTLTTVTGDEIGHSEVVLGKCAQSVTVELKVPPGVTGQALLKATLYLGDQVVDNGRSVVAM